MVLGISHWALSDAQQQPEYLFRNVHTVHFKTAIAQHTSERFYMPNVRTVHFVVPISDDCTVVKLFFGRIYDICRTSFPGVRKIHISWDHHLFAVQGSSVTDVLNNCVSSKAKKDTVGSFRSRFCARVAKISWFQN